MYKRSVVKRFEKNTKIEKTQFLKLYYLSQFDYYKT